MQDIEQVRSRVRQEVLGNGKICGLENMRQEMQVTASSFEA